MTILLGSPELMHTPVVITLADLASSHALLSGRRSAVVAAGRRVLRGLISVGAAALAGSRIAVRLVPADVLPQGWSDGDSAAISMDIDLLGVTGVDVTVTPGTSLVYAFQVELAMYPSMAFVVFVAHNTGVPLVGGWFKVSDA